MTCKKPEAQGRRCYHPCDGCGLVWAFILIFFKFFFVGTRFSGTVRRGDGTRSIIEILKFAMVHCNATSATSYKDQLSKRLQNYGESKTQAHVQKMSYLTVMQCAWKQFLVHTILLQVDS